MPNESKVDGPFLVGGVGGSGTRAIATILESMGLFMGHDLNESKDNLSFSHASKFLIQNFDLPVNEIIQKERPLLDQHNQLLAHHHIESGKKKWGWKVPGNFYHLHQLVNYYGNKIHYIHIIRNGLDMAFSQNQNQLHNYGHYFNIDIKKLPLPLASLQYWNHANQYAIKTAEYLLKDKFLLIKFENLCKYPKETIESMIKFCKVKTYNNTNSLIKLVKQPNTIGRYKNRDLSIFNSDDLLKVESFGYLI